MIVIDKESSCNTQGASATYDVTETTQFTMTGSANVAVKYNGALVATLTQSEPTYMAEALGEYELIVSQTCNAVTVNADEVGSDSGFPQIQNCNDDIAVSVYDPCVEEAISQVNQSLQAINDSINNQTTTLTQQLDLIEQAIRDVIVTIDDGVDVNATQQGQWQVEVTNPTDINTLAQEISQALDGLNVNIAGQAADLNVNVTNDSIVVEVDNLPVIPFDVEIRDVCYFVSGGSDVYGMPSQYISLASSYDTIIIDTININGQSFPFDMYLKYNGDWSMSPEQFLQLFHSRLRQNAQNVESIAYFGIDSSYAIYIHEDGRLGNQYGVTVTTGQGDTADIDFQSYSLDGSYLGNGIRAIQHIIYNEDGSVHSIYYTDTLGLDVSGEVVDCSTINPSNTVLRQINSDEFFSGLDIVVTVRNGTADVSVNSGIPVTFGDTGSTVLAYRTEPHDGTVGITNLSADADVLVEYREV